MVRLSLLVVRLSPLWVRAFVFAARRSLLAVSLTFVAVRLSLCVGMVTFVGVAQAKPRPPEPAAFAVVYRLQGQSLVDLEMRRPVRESLEVQAPVRREYLVVDSARSPVRFADPQGLRFVVRFRLSQPDFAWNFNQLEPTDFSLYLLQREGQRRILMLSEQTPIRRVSYPGLPLRVTPYGRDSLSLELPSGLAAGEYAIAYGKDKDLCDLFCFALDGPLPQPSSAPQP